MSSCKKDVEPEDENVFNDERDNKEYKFVIINNQTWMAQNLNYEMENSTWYAGAYEYGEQFGRLYTYVAAHDACPEGWHLPKDGEWIELERFMGMPEGHLESFDNRGTTEGLQLKSEDGWVHNGYDEFGFKALPGGFHRHSFTNINKVAWFWTGSNYLENEEDAIMRTLDNSSNLIRSPFSKTAFLSVRCVKD